MGYLIDKKRMVLLAFVLMLTSTAAGQTSLVTADLKLDAVPVMVKPFQWGDRTALMAVVPKRRSRTLVLAGFENGGLKILAKFPLPQGMRWIEPMQLGGQRTVWLGLIGNTLVMGSGKSKISWQPLCDCNTLFSGGRSQLPAQVQFATDLDGDGRDEIILPGWEGLTIARLNEAKPSIEPLVRVHWDISENYALNNDQLSLLFHLPRFMLVDSNGDKILDFVQISGNRLLIAPLSKPAAPQPGPYFTVHPGKLPLLRQLGLSAQTLSTLEALSPSSFRGEGAFFKAFKETAEKDKASGDHLTQKQRVMLLDQLRGEIPVLFAQVSQVGDEKRPPKKESHRIHSVADMDGDGTLDVIHMKSTDSGGLLSQKNRLRWFPGSRVGNQLQFSNDKPQVFFSEGPAFAELVWPQTAPNQTPAMFLATTEVNLLAVIRAFTLNTVVLNLYVYPWQDRKLMNPPPIQANLAFELKKKDKKNRPMIFLADMNGDGWREYLFNMETDQLTVFRGRARGPDLGGNPMTTKNIPLPTRPQTIFVADLNRDKQEELILWYWQGENPDELRKTLRVVSMKGGR